MLYFKDRVGDSFFLHERSLFIECNSFKRLAPDITPDWWNLPQHQMEIIVIIVTIFTIVIIVTIVIIKLHHQMEGWECVDHGGGGHGQRRRRAEGLRRLWGEIDVVDPVDDGDFVDDGDDDDDDDDDEMKFI